MKRTLVILVVLTLLLLGCGQAFAGTIDYYETADVFYMFDNMQSRGVVTINVWADTKNVFCDEGGYCFNSGQAKLHIAGLDLNLSEVVLVQLSTRFGDVEFFDNRTSALIWGTVSAALKSYDLKGYFATITGLPLPSSGPGGSFETDGGLFQIDGFPTGKASFGAAIPEPGSLSLLAAFGLITMGLVRRKS